jgi:hypothetical protein
MNNTTVLAWRQYPVPDIELTTTARCTAIVTTIRNVNRPKVPWDRMNEIYTPGATPRELQPAHHA